MKLRILLVSLFGISGEISLGRNKIFLLRAKLVSNRNSFVYCSYLKLVSFG
ncbi:hypothetical protein P3G55_01320 [Leptospira sp. 96542]|nr:hypothetical protein [Leptospira sp. 96542]